MGVVEASVFLVFLKNRFLAETAKRKEKMMKVLYDEICSGDPSTSSTSSSTSSTSSSPEVVRRGITYSELESHLCACYPQTPQALSLRIFRDAYRQSGCCLPSFASVLEACQRNDFFTLCLRLPDVCDTTDRWAPLKASENSAVVKTVSQHIALFKPELDDCVRVLLWGVGRCFGWAEVEG
ncbi:uncharacterized protein MONOS_14256 [Monocercomonoides exilis]|uniref:uncharacterized protein n=1 Tax=Monocercomonoides exilis TaxID=2049356 RepID=UPI0035599F70|nr:hypothetical protein MONOS_14256 [Monocercomonoides exilis]|eukprot:MONOS_14256.1-p1 / transcript=MONOS_14256.1 / gene=MONOS_14256 / organism=Monocercomonoides_exilis_PA203 / gene_product=unspecified product / transcript_product=unspecified product / location=Mono_scaffold00965:7454-7996(-) / protein_length=181 / sequence_SO=supercontig / SO=protein_coding / is_pseudo=false